MRALTRIATPENEAGLAEIAGPMTGNQLERFARAHRQVTQADDAAARVRRRLAWRIEDDGSLAGTFRLPPLQAAVLLKALRAAAGDLEHPHDAGTGDVSAETSARDKPTVETSTSLADALVAISEAFLAEKVAIADDPDVYQVIVHVGTNAVIPPAPSTLPAGPSTTPSPPPDPGTEARPPATQPATPPAGAPGGVSAETPEPARQVPKPGRRFPGHPADPARCHVEDGPAVSVSTAQTVACTATLSWMLHDHDGTLLDVGRRRRRPTSALRRAARERDKCRCRFPGCESRRVDLHHIQYWSNGGRTKLANLVSLCKYHHMLVHERGYLIAAAPDGAFAFSRPDGRTIPAAPALPDVAGGIEGCHDADINPGTIIPAWYGERLDLDHAIYVCFANAANQACQRDAGEQQDEREQAEPLRPQLWAVNPFQWLAGHRPVSA